MSKDYNTYLVTTIYEKACFWSKIRNHSKWTVFDVNQQGYILAYRISSLFGPKYPQYSWLINGRITNMSSTEEFFGVAPLSVKRVGNAIRIRASGAHENHAEGLVQKRSVLGIYIVCNGRVFIQKFVISPIP